MSRILRGPAARLAVAACIVGACVTASASAQAQGAPPDASAAAKRCPITTTNPDGQFPNPLHRCRIADPGIWRVGNNTWYTFSTGGDSSGAFPIRKSMDNRKTWTTIGMIFARGRMPVWTRQSSKFWAPQVYAINGRYVAYFAATGPGIYFSIGAATAPSPEGPWTDIGRPLVNRANFSVIDPYFFHDPRSRKNYLLWKNNINAQGRPTHIMIREVSANGLKLLGKEAHPTLVNDQAWEGNVIEAPSMEYRNGSYYLFYSGNTFSSGRYAVGFARSKSPSGGFHKHPTPMLRGNSRFRGPGGQDVVRGPNNEWIIFYHASPNFAPFNKRGRYLMMDNITWTSDDWPQVHNGSSSN
jgi:arabinan endo-1,5-alpha-L-arabinosidase